MIDQETGMPMYADYEQYEEIKQELDKYKEQNSNLKELIDSLIETIEDSILDTKKELAKLKTN